MNNILSKIAPINKDNTINIFIEISKESKNKYELDKKSGLIKLDRVLYSAQSYPFDYGFLPNTLWKDGDPIDVVLLSSYPIMPGVLVEGRVVACLNMIDNNESDIKIIAVVDKDPRFSNINDLKDINIHTIDEIKHFFETYKILEKKEVKIPNVFDKNKAIELIKESINIFKKKSKVKKSK